MASGAKSKGTQAAVWVIILLLIFGLMGFGATNFGGTINSIGSVGDREISVQRYAQDLQNQMQQFSRQTGQPMTLAQARAFGLDAAVLQRLVSTAALEHEAAERGISAGDSELRDQILTLSAFQGLDGTFDREAYRFALERSGLNERAFESDLRSEIARTILEGAVTGGIEGSGTYSDAIYEFVGERRDFSWSVLTVDDLADAIADPTESDLQRYYSENEPDFMLPETREITYVSLSPDMLVDTVPVEDADLEALYQERIDEFVQPERRLVERLVLGDAAEEAKTRLDANEVTFEELVAERELSLTDVDLGDVSETDLGSVGAEVFALDGPGIAGPVDTELGAALFRVNAVLAAQEVPFEDAKAGLKAEFALEESANIIAEQIEDIDDLLAGGATLEELASETDLQLSEFTLTEASIEGIAASSAFRRAGLGAAVGDFPEIIETEDGGIFALRVNEIVEPRLEEFDSAKGRIEAGWRRQETVRVLTEQAEAIAGQLRADTSPEELGLTLTEETNRVRTDFIADAPAETMLSVFEMEVGEIRVEPAATSVVVIRLNAINGPDPDDQDLLSQRDALQNSVARAIGSDLLNAFAGEIEAEVGIFLDQAAIGAVHTQMP